MFIIFPTYGPFRYDGSPLLISILNCEWVKRSIAYNISYIISYLDNHVYGILL